MARSNVSPDVATRAQPPTHAMAVHGGVGDASTTRAPSATRYPRSSASPLGPELSEYELARLENIARNNVLLASLGLLAPPVPNPPAAGRTAAAPKAIKRAPSSPLVRRLTRARAHDGARDGADTRARAHGPACEARPLDEAHAHARPDTGAQAGVVFEDSAVLCHVLRQRAREGDANGAMPDAEVRGYRRCAHLPECVSLIMSKIYALDLAPAHACERGWLVAAAGEKGLVEVYGALPSSHADGASDQSTSEGDAAADGEAEHARALLSFRAHAGWVGGVQLLPARASESGAGGAALLGGWLLSAANDGALRLWDLRSTAREGASVGMPRLVAEQAESHSSKGIFAMHERDARVLTASKAGSVGLTVLAPDGRLRAARVWASACGGGVVKSVAWSGADAAHGLGPETFAAGGRAGAVALFDAREPTERAAARLERTHPHDVHTVRWQPRDAGAMAEDGLAGEGGWGPLLLTASFDPSIQLWDARRLDAPVARLEGHVGAHIRRQARIHQPVFGGCARIVATGEGAGALSVYCAVPGVAEFGRAIGRDFVGCEPSTLAPAPGASGVVAMAHGRTVVLLEPSPCATASARTWAAG
ncbi:hypothetical protein KFE25_000469 [Diacronema lutheri]|uniref:Uncharacterized protein n=1 Tax=Diacronema lutheri TaxID=2081491 RepID=A0A8J6CGX7_DIALT|nr:hypothetical protein KFE25_000469 [Diacronema lutheri]